MHTGKISSGIVLLTAIVATVTAAQPDPSIGRRQFRLPSSRPAGGRQSRGGCPATQATGSGELCAVDLGAGVTMALVYIPGGRFLMGSSDAEREEVLRRITTGAQSEFTRDLIEAVKLEGPAHAVELDGFWMGKFEVTVAQFRRFVEEASYQTDAERKAESSGVGPSGDWSKVRGLNWRNPGFDQGDDHPVVHVSWNDAKAFCDWLSRKRARRLRLPTEAEWEYACRAGTRTAYVWGDDPDAGDGWLNGPDRTAMRKYPAWPVFGFDDGYLYTASVGTFKANAFGLHDMHGNVWEWCGDYYGPQYYSESPLRNPRGPSAGVDRMSRGGSWDYYQHLFRSAARVRLSPGSTYCGQGFRVVCDAAAPR